MQAALFGSAFVFTHNAQAAERSDYINATFPWSLPHVGNQCFVNFKWHAFLKFPAQHGNRFLGTARKLIEMLNEYSNNGVRQKQRSELIFGAQTVADALHRGSHRGSIDDIGFDRGRNDRARRKRLHGKTVQRTSARKACARNAIGSDLDGNRWMRLSVQPEGNFPD